MKFLHLSDLHFHRSNSKNEAIVKTLRNVETLYPEHILVITGDITDDGAEEQYENAQAALLPFKGRIFVVIGNHDQGAAGNLYSKRRAKLFDEYLMAPLNQNGRFAGDNEPIVNVLKDGDTNVMMIGLDTNLATIHCFDFACGKVGSTQLEALRGILASPNSRNYTKVLYFHHHPFYHSNFTMRLKDADDLARVIYGQVDVVMFGHKHKSGYWEQMYDQAQVLASDNSPGKSHAREIEIIGHSISVREVPITT